jgi:hypothetical protein
MSGDVVSSPAKNEGCIGAPKSERVAQYPIQGPAKIATRFRHIQRRQGRIAYAIPEMRRESAGGVTILHRQPTQSSLDGSSGPKRMPGEWFSRAHRNLITEERVDEARFHGVILHSSRTMEIYVVDRLGRNSSA